MRHIVWIHLALLVGCTRCASDEAAGAPDGSGAGSGTTTSTTTTSTRPLTLTTPGPPSPFPGWTAIPGLPGHCEVYAADEPAALDPLTWVTCAGGTPGCLELVTTWATPAQTYRFYVPFAGGPTPAGPVLVVRAIRSGELMGWHDHLVAYSDGAVLSALRARSAEFYGCAPGFAQVGADRVLWTVTDFTISPLMTEREMQMLLSGGPAYVYNTVADLHGAIGHLRSAGGTFAAVSYSGGYILTVPYDGSAPTRIAGLSDPATDSPASDGIAVGTDVLYWKWHADLAREHIYRSSTATTEVLIERPDWDVYGLRTDGHDLVWLESSPPRSMTDNPTAFELWTSPYATSAQALVRQKIASLTPELAQPYTSFQDGIFVLRHSSWARDVALRLADRVYFTLDAPPGQWWGDAAYVTAEEIALPVQPPWDAQLTSTVRRQRFADLGAPKPVPALLTGD
ncbi:MAG: hypothetical protein HY825_01925 [Acidobacteria bacterium]|nr:hypothetical protein [Acidobacteriota bacterium]